MSYDAEAEARRLNGCPRLAGCPADRVSGCDALCRDARQRAEDALRAAYAAGERAGAERMREQAARWHDAEERREAALTREHEARGNVHGVQTHSTRSLVHYGAARAIRALPLDGGDEA